MGHLKTPVEVKFWWPHGWLKRDPRRHLKFAAYVQWMVNRLLVGGLRYGPASKTQCYYKRAMMELEAYEKTGNMEHLVNVSNYGFLECQTPSIKGAHFANDVKSATRKKFGTGGFVGEHEK